MSLEANQERLRYVVIIQNCQHFYCGMQASFLQGLYKSYWIIAASKSSNPQIVAVVKVLQSSVDCFMSFCAFGMLQQQQLISGKDAQLIQCFFLVHDDRHESSIVERNEYKIISRVTRRFCRSRKSQMNQINERVITIRQSDSHEKKLSYIV